MTFENTSEFLGKSKPKLPFSRPSGLLRTTPGRRAEAHSTLLSPMTALQAPEREHSRSKGIR